MSLSTVASSDLSNTCYCVQLCCPILNIKQPIQNIRDPGKPGKVVRKHEPTTNNQIGQYSQEGTQGLKYFWKQNSIINYDKQIIYAMSKSILTKRSFNHDSVVEYNFGPTKIYTTCLNQVNSQIGNQSVILH